MGKDSTMATKPHLSHRELFRRLEVRILPPPIFFPSLIGSIIITLSPPLAAGFSIAENHPDANR
jgi:hypothetical protein